MAAADGLLAKPGLEAGTGEDSPVRRGGGVHARGSNLRGGRPSRACRRRAPLLGSASASRKMNSVAPPKTEETGSRKRARGKGRRGEGSPPQPRSLPRCGKGRPVPGHKLRGRNTNPGMRGLDWGLRKIPAPQPHLRPREVPVCPTVPPAPPCPHKDHRTLSSPGHLQQPNPSATATPKKSPLFRDRKTCQQQTSDRFLC